MGWIKKIATGSAKLAEATGTGIKQFSEWQDRQQAKNLARKQKQLSRLRIEAKIAREKAKIRKYKPKDPFDDWNI